MAQNNVLNYNNDFLYLKSENDVFINNNEKELNLFFSPNILDISTLNQMKESIDPLYDEENSQFSQLILGPNIKNIFSIEESEIKEKETNKITKSKFIIKKQNINSNNKNKIFKTKKVLKPGRIKKNSSKKGKHDKFQKDNIIRRFKVFLMRNIFNYINNSFIINTNKDENNRVNVLQRISSFNSKSISKQDNIKWLNSKIKDVFSENLKKFICFDLDYNKKLINKVIQEGKEKKTIFILNKTIKEIWIAYINDDKNNNFIGFDTIKQDIIKLRKLGETETYINLYIKVANDFENIFNEINPRKTRRKK
jgi:hypothetical protein